jgi:glycine/D-amino acid oxidase-like deaminating enzyme
MNVNFTLSQPAIKVLYIQRRNRMDLLSNSPFWLIRDGMMGAYYALDQDLTCDVVVIGGGITGALASYHLTQAGMNTVLLDKRNIGWGSTSGTTALLQYEIDTPLHQLVEMVGADHAVRAYLACSAAIDKIEDLTQELGDACGFERKKSLYLASRTRDVALLKKEFVIRRKYGIELDWLDEEQIADLFPFRRPAALLSQQAAQIDAYKLTHRLIQKAMKWGLHVFARTCVAQINPGVDGKITLTTDRDYRVVARNVVFATGYESQQYLSQPVAKLISTYALASEPLRELSSWYDQCLIWETARPYLYLRTTGDSRVIMGGEDEDFRDPARRDRLLGRKTRKLQKRFAELFPHLDLEVAFAWAGTFGETKDGLAYIDQHPEWPNAYFVLGYGGNGITYSMLGAEIVRDAILGRPNPNADLFRFDR